LRGICRRTSWSRRAPVRRNVFFMRRHGDLALLAVRNPRFSGATMRIESLALTFTLAAATPAFADDAAPTKTKTIGIDGGVALPAGDWGNAAGFGFGALARFEMPLMPKLVLTGRAGYIQHLSKSAGDMGGGGDSSASEIPLLAGVRYMFSQKPTSAFYGAAELGFFNLRASVDVGGMSQSSSDTKFGMTLGAGYRTGKLDLRGGLVLPDAGNLVGVMATVGYDITAF
jgi:hypothetical protein